MNCYYCDKIKASDPTYEGLQAAFDLGSAAPRCSMHWRYLCAECGEPSHFMATAYDPRVGKFYCSGCATAQEEVAGSFWAWKYFFRYRSPWSSEWTVSLDRLEYERRHPTQLDQELDVIASRISTEKYLVRYSEQGPTSTLRSVTDEDVQSNWNRNAERWNARYDDDGDENRRYQSDEPMLKLLGEVHGKRILDVGCGNGYLCRKLAKAGAAVTGVDLSDGFLAIAMSREREENLGISYHHGSASEMDFLSDRQFDKAVANYVLMDIQNYTGAIRHVFQLLRSGGCFVAVISQPCGPKHAADRLMPAPDSPRREEATGWRADMYFHRGPYFSVWGDLDPVLSFHRPLRDYWEAFVESGFVVDTYEEPSITERGLRDLPVSQIDNALRTPYSCIFRMVKPTK